MKIIKLNNHSISGVPQPTETSSPAPFLTPGWIRSLCSTTDLLAKTTFLHNSTSANHPLVCYGGVSLIKLYSAIPITTFSALQTGVPTLDTFHPEYSPWVASQSEDETLSTVLALLRWVFFDEGLDCARFAAVTEQDRRLLQVASSICGARFVDERTDESFSLDLSKLSHKGFDICAIVSANTRSNIRRGRKHFGIANVSDITTSDSRDAALKFLIDQHQNRWVAKGEPGAFASDTFTEFIHHLVDKGESIRLLEVSAHGKRLGVVLNLCTPRCDHYYLSGIDYSENRHHPGLIVHAAVAEYLARQGVRTYDFMAGSSQYKRSLATDRFPVYWVRVERKNIKTTIIALATQVKKLLKSMLQVAKVR